MKVLARLAAACLLVASAGAQTAPQKLPSESPNLDFDLLVVRLPEETALPLIPELRERKQAAAAARKIVDLITAKKAELLGWPLLTTKSAVRAVVEQIDEVRYATEFVSPGRKEVVQTQGPPVPNSLTGNVTTTTIVDDGIPSSFETRNVGVTLELEPVLAPDGKTIDLQLTPQHIRFLGYRKIEIEQKDTGKKIVVEQPDFLTHKVTTSLTVQDGDHTLLGVFKVNDPPGQMELFILHSQVRPVEAATPALPKRSPARR